MFRIDWLIDWMNKTLRKLNFWEIYIMNSMYVFVACLLNLHRPLVYDHKCIFNVENCRMMKVVYYCACGSSHTLQWLIHMSSTSLSGILLTRLFTLFVEFYSRNIVRLLLLVLKYFQNFRAHLNGFIGSVRYMSNMY